MSEKYLTFPELMARLKIGRSTIYRRIADGTLPKPVKIGHLRRFKESEVDEALKALEDTRKC